MANRPTVDTGDGPREVRLWETQRLIEDATTREGIGLHDDRYREHQDYQLFRGRCGIDRIRAAQMKPKNWRS